MKTLKLVFSLLLSVSVTFVYAQEPVNDHCESATELVLGSECILQEYSSIGATAQPDSIAGNPSCGSYQGGDVWFTFEVPASGNFRVEMTSSGNNSQWQMYSGTCGAFESIWCGTNGGNLINNFFEPELAGETLYLRSWRWNSTDGIDFSLCVSESFPPANDLCANAIVLPVGQECVMQDFTSEFAGAEPDSIAPNPSCGNYHGGDVWFTFEVPASGNFRIEMAGAGNNSQWELYSGVCGDFAQITCASNGNQLYQNFILPDLAGETLYLRSWRFNSSLGIDFSVCIQEITSPVNDMCSNAIELPVGEIGGGCQALEFSSVWSTSESLDVAPNPTCGYYSGGDVWFRFEVPQSGNFRIELQNITTGPAIWQMYSGTCGNFEPIQCSNSQVNYTEPEWGGETFYIRVHRQLNTNGNDFSLCIVEFEPPINNLCADAIALPVGAIGEDCQALEFSSVWATAEPVDIAPNPTCGYYSGGDIWFTFEVPESGNFRVEIANVTAGTAIWQMYSGTCGNFEPVGCSNSQVNYTESQWGGEMFYLRVFRQLSPHGNEFSLCIYETEPPVNNFCADAIALPVGAIGEDCQALEFSSVWATAEPVDIAPNPTCGYYSGGDVWFTFEVPQSGNFRVEIQNITSGTAIWQMYSGNCGDFEPRGCSNGQVNFTEPQWGGETFYLRVFRQLSIHGNDFGLCIYETDPPVNNNCTDPLTLSVSDFCNPQIHSTFFSTSEALEVAPNPPCGNYAGGDVWFNFVVPSSGDFRVEVSNQSSGSAFWTLYNGTCGSFLPLHCSNGGVNFSEPGWIGDTLTVRVYRQFNSQGMDFGICIYDLDIPDNNDCEDAFELTLGENCEMQFFSNEGATASLPGIAPDPTCGAYQGGDVWFKFTVPTSGRFRIERNNYLGVNANWTLYTGSCGAFEQIACSQLNAWQNYLHPELAGETIYMRVFNYNNANGGTFELCVWEVPQPENDLCANAIHLPVSGECQMETFSNAYTFDDEAMPAPSCGLYQGGDVWFTFVAPPSGQFQISRNHIEGVNASMTVYSGTCEDFLELECVHQTNQINFNDVTLAGDTLYLRVFGFNNAAGGTFGLCITDTSVPENDHCADAIPLPVSTSCNFQQFSNYNSTDETGIADNPSCGLYQGGDVWFSFIVPPSGKFLIQRNNLDGNIRYNLYTGACGNFSELDCPANPEAASYDEPEWAGDTIYLRAYRQNNPFGGIFEMCIVEGDCNGDFGGTAYLDECNTCVGGETGLEPCEQDCNGVYGGWAFIDNCGDCVGGNTGQPACVADCNGEFGGTAYLDNCGQCVDGDTGEEACVADCNGDFGGTAFIDDCNNCVGGETGETACGADCNGDFGGTAYFDNCSICVEGETGLEPCEADCNGDFGGTAFLDECGDCVGGNTGETACIVDCNGVYGGLAYLDNCNTCVGGDTGLEPCLQDCNGVFGGSAFIDDCEDCVGGSTGLTACVEDCNGEFGGTAFIDNCDNCVGGNTGEEACTECALELSGSFTAATSGNADGSASVIASGGTEPYEYLWNDALMQTSATATGLFAGDYTVVVTDANDCEEQLVVTVPVSSSVPNTQVSAEYCNTSGHFLSDFISAIGVSGANAYRWEFTDPNNNVLPEFTRIDGNKYLRLEWVDDILTGLTYNVRVKARVGNDWGEYATICSIGVNPVIPTTELRPNYSPTNVQGNPYELCDLATAFNIANAQNFRWRFDPDMDPNSGNEIIYTRGSGNPSIRLSWVNGITPGLIYNVGVEVQVDGIWSGYGNVLPLEMNLPPNDIQLRNPYCGGTYALNGYVLSTSACEADNYFFEFENVLSGSIHTRSSANYVCFLNQVSPALSPGEYNVRVRVTQNGVPGDFGPVCQITIGGAGLAEEGIASMKSLENTGSATLFPNPNAGREVRVQLDGLSEGNHKVNIVVYDLYGKQISSDGFGHEGNSFSRLIRFDGNLSMGVYMVQILVDGEQFAIERLVVK